MAASDMSPPLPSMRPAFQISPSALNPLGFVSHHYVRLGHNFICMLFGESWSTSGGHAKRRAGSLCSFSWGQAS